jgi:hypothetical protein
MVTLELTAEEAETLGELLRERVAELDRAINRTDSLVFKRELQQVNRTVERILGRLSATLAGAPHV